jgi:hypothetical protein
MMIATVLIVFGVSLTVFGIAAMALSRGQSLVNPNYQAWLAFGVLFAVLGFGTNNPTILILGIGLVVAALSRKERMEARLATAMVFSQGQN